MKKTFATLLFALSAFAVAAQSSFNYYCGFETEYDRTGWLFKTGYGVSTRFAIGNAVSRIGSHSMYVSADGGVSAGYVSTPSGFITVAYRRFTLDAGNYDISFDIYTADSLPTADVLRLAYFPTVGIDGSPQTPSGASNGSLFPELVDNNSFLDSEGTKDFIARGWRTIQGKLTVPLSGDYWLAFYFKETGGVHSENSPGACVDNIRIASERADEDCTAMVKSMEVSYDSSLIQLSWQGNAPEYQLMYHRTAPSPDTAYTVVSGITEENYPIATNAMAEGCYNFCIRPVCGQDTGMWGAYLDVLVYRPEERCIDYLDLKSPDVKCTSGTFANPYAQVGTVDYGAASVRSMHTIHFRGDEYDRLTGYKLKTVPDGAIVSVRLSNWAEKPASSGSIEYSYRVQPDAEVLLLRYAAVLQYESDHKKPEEQTRIHVEVQDSAGNLLSHCTEVDFNSLDVSQGNTRGWNTYLPAPGSGLHYDCPVKWLDWSILGIDLRQYVGSSIKIRITTYACVQDMHFAYAYFTLDCTGGGLEGVSCGEVPTHFTAPEGFKYKWYKMSDSSAVPEAHLSDGGRTFTPLAGDTCSYFVDLIYPEDDNCKFTLRAYMLPRVPLSDASFKCNPRNCQNVVDITNSSAVYSYPEGLPPILRPDTIDSYYWDFGEYGTSTEKTPQLVIPLAGDTFTVTLRTVFNGCNDVKQFTVEVPHIKHQTMPDSLEVALGTDYGDVCSSEEEEEFDVPYTVGRGEVSVYSVDYGEAAERAGFVDVDSVEAGDGFISLLKPGGVRPGRYSAAVTFYNSDCGNLVLPFEFEVKYPSEVIAQRWNDVLAVKNAEHNGGYDFVGYQWYLEGLPIEGAIRSQHYAEGGMLEFGKEYSVLLTRADDGVSVMTCVYTPTEFETEKYTEVSSVVFGGSEVAVEVDRQAVVRLYTVSGLRVSEQRIYPGANSVVMPTASGVYLLRVDYADGASEVHRVVVK